MGLGDPGSQPPEIFTEVPGPASLRYSTALEELEAPGINTIYRGRPSLLWQEALGSNVVDVDGNRFVDLTAGFGVAGIGHRHPKVVEALARQGHSLIHGLGDVMAHPQRVELCRRLRDLVPVRDRTSAQTHLAVSGADALEIAAKTAILHHRSLNRPRQSFLVFDPAYHGLSLGALALTSRDEFRNPFLPHLHPHIERRPFGGSLRKVAQLLEEGRVAAAVVEPVVGREGVRPAPDGWLAELAELCRRTETILIADEIFTGFGRTGRLFAVEHQLSIDDGSLPDLVCCGKALAGGLPIGAVVGRRQLMAAWSTSGEAIHTGTFVGHPLACATANATLEVVTKSDEPLAQRAARLGEGVAKRLASWPARFEEVESIRGLGLLWGIVLRDSDTAAGWSAKARSRGILLLAGGPEGRVAQLVPPLTIDRDLLHLSLDLLEECF
ncbi:MAG: aspartate aminotransferase family protein [Thermoanaerobaculia bacterium]|nr:aspartate aminotransferase family protein [Thermoanaerobaculia bacterium]